MSCTFNFLAHSPLHTKHKPFLLYCHDAKLALGLDLDLFIVSDCNHLIQNKSSIVVQIDDSIASSRIHDI
jgi:hypothetical protein